mgnify:CR=1 FL=1
MSSLNIFAFADEASGQIDKQIVAMQRNSLQGLEIRGVDGQSIADISMEKAREVRRKMDDAGLTVWSMGSPIGKIGIEDDFAAHLDKLRHVLELADVLGAENVRMFSFFVPEGKAADYRNKVIDQVGQMVDVARGSGVVLCHENEKGIYGDDTARNADLLNVFGDRLGFAFDPANFIQCEVNTLEAYETLHDRITYMHIKDALMADGAVVCAGHGDGDVPEILRRLNAEREDEIILTVEPHLTVFKGLEKLQDEQLRHHETYPDSRTAFHAAVQALKDIINNL